MNKVRISSKYLTISLYDQKEKKKIGPVEEKSKQIKSQADHLIVIMLLNLAF